MTTLEVLAEIDGIVSQVVCKVGDHVNEGDEVLVLESMKMEIGVLAPASGRVSRIEVTSADAVTKNQLLLMLETVSSQESDERDTASTTQDSSV